MRSKARNFFKQPKASLEDRKIPDPSSLQASPVIADSLPIAQAALRVWASFAQGHPSTDPVRAEIPGSTRAGEAAVPDACCPLRNHRTRRVSPRLPRAARQSPSSACDRSCGTSSATSFLTIIFLCRLINEYFLFFFFLKFGHKYRPCLALQRGGTAVYSVA